jgi:hypothetical protein
MHPARRQLGMKSIEWRRFIPPVCGNRICFTSGREVNVHSKDAAALYAKSRLRDRIDAIIAHEQQEGMSFSHAETSSGKALRETSVAPHAIQSNDDALSRSRSRHAPRAVTDRRRHAGRAYYDVAN